MKVPFLDLRVTDPIVRQELLEAVQRVLDHGRFLLGPELVEFEDSMAADCRREHAIGVGSGTAALYVGLRSLGIGPGDEVITGALSWIATANAIAMTGATPVFADLQDDLNIDPASAARLVTRRTKAVVVVHFTGRVCRMDQMMQLCQREDLLLVEDACQAFHAEFQGHRAGQFGDIACFSANPMKVFAACGEAGFVVTDRADVAQSIRSLRYSGTVNREVCEQPGFNLRLDTLQAAILLVRLNHVDQIIQRRREIARQYRQRLHDVVQTPREQPDEHHVYYTFTIQTDRRDELMDYLSERDIETKVQHRCLMPDQPAYRADARGEFSNARRLVERILSIPASESLTDNQLEYVADCICAFFAK